MSGFSPLTMPAAGAPAQDAMSVQAVEAAVRQAGAWVPALREAMGQVLVGQKALVERLLVGLLANGHILLEGVPGLAKTLALKTLAQAVSVNFHRIQFTPDMLPADVVGTLIYNPQAGNFETKFGPIFANLVLADEINRAPAKVQSALLEAMQERQVTLGDTTYALPQPFLVMATQNPVEQEGTYPLPEAQVDRFLLKVVVTYPSRAEERQILDRMATTATAPGIAPVVSGEAILQARAVMDQIYLDPKVRDYIVEIVHTTREPQAQGLDLAAYLQYGASPRATLALTLGAKALAFLAGRGYVTPQDVKTIAPDALRHRLVLTYEAEAENLTPDTVLQRILEALPVP